MWYVFPVQYEELRINHLTLLLVVTMSYTCWFLWRAYHIEDFKWRLIFQFWACVLKGCFGGLVWRAKSCLKGIEDFNLEHLSGHVSVNFIAHTSLSPPGSLCTYRILLHIRHHVAICSVNEPCCGTIVDGKRGDHLVSNFTFTFMCEVNLDGLCAFGQWELLDSNGHGPLV